MLRRKSVEEEMNYTKFTIRDKKPTANDKYAKCYIRKEAGWSWAVIESPTDSERNVGRRQ